MGMRIRSGIKSAGDVYGDGISVQQASSTAVEGESFSNSRLKWMAARLLLMMLLC